MEYLFTGSPELKPECNKESGILLGNTQLKGHVKWNVSMHRKGFFLHEQIPCVLSSRVSV